MCLRRRPDRWPLRSARVADCAGLACVCGQRYRQTMDSDSCPFCCATNIELYSCPRAFQGAPR
eukprot:11181462-Lingulodinium_polyedra.AAC.1